MASKWRANAEYVHNMKRQWTTLNLDVRYKPKQEISRHNTAAAAISTGAFVKIMISRLQTNGTGISQRLCCTLKTTTSPLCRTGQSILIKLIAANRPDIIVKDLLNSSCKLWNQIETSH